MTKKDYQLIAEAFAQLKPTEYTKDLLWTQLVENLATRLKLENPKFNKQKFLAACGLQD